ncbi:hypothetical protein J4476_03890 [Candidatus Woesearchaeota archaeon]|nr:hypothetical protein [Candidatus Woesearchaeota archaeon]HIH26348.1 hypothetical protein [Nanoarchaeota archaeon]
MKTQITVKEVEDKTFQELKAEAVKRKMSIGTALTLAIENWLSSIKKPRGSLLMWKSTDWGPGTEKLSEQVDEIIYGDK